MEVPRHWRLKKQRYALMGETYPNCKAHLFPPRAVCPQCGGDMKQAMLVQEPEHAVALSEHLAAANR